MTRELSQTSEKILQLVQVALCLLLKVGLLAMAWKRKETAALFTIQSIPTLKRTWKKALIHEFEENQGFMVFSSMPLNIDMKMIRSSKFFKINVSALYVFLNLSKQFQ